MNIRDLHPATDLAAVHGFYRDAPDYWIMAEGAAPGVDKARAFFKDCPPECNPDQSRRLGMFLEGRLSGIAELSFGFPSKDDAYLGFMMLGPWARNAGFGSAFLAHVTDLARKASAPALYLAVLDVNQGGCRFWVRHGFQPTGVIGSTAGGLGLTRLRKALKTPYAN